MALSKFESFPPCCQPILESLERERRRGARNCPKGHLVSLEYARQLQEAAAKAAAAAPPSEPEPKQ